MKNGSLTIKENNEIKNNKIQWQKNKPQKYIVTYIYSAKAYEKIKETLKNEKIKSDAENEINYAIIKNDAGEDINSNLREERKSFSITTKDVVVLAIIGIMIVICLIILEINIMKRKNN